MEIDYKNMGLRIKKRRNQLKLKQNVLAEQVDISNNHLSSIERGKEIPSLEVLVKICNALNVTPDYLLLGNMHSNNVEYSMYESLRLCSQRDIEIIKGIIQIFVERNSKYYNDVHYT